MKKAIHVSLILMNMITISKAQHPSFGITTGVSAACFKSEAYTRASSFFPTLSTSVSSVKSGIMLGAVSSFNTGKHMSIRPEVNYIQKGGKENNESYILNYLELPVNFVYHSNGRQGKFFVGGGPSFGFGLFGKTKTESSAYTGDINFGKNDDDYLHSFEFEANFIAGYELKNGFLFSANYNLSLNNIANEQPPNPGGGRLVTFYNRYFGFRVGYMFASKEK